MNTITGTWELLSLELKKNSEEPLYPFGKDPVGLVLYRKDGYMSGIIAGKNRPNVSKPALLGIPEDERAKIAENFIAYAGLYRTEKDRLIHGIEVSFVPNLMDGPDHIQKYTIENDILKIESAASSPNRTQNIKIIWKRKKGMNLSNEYFKKTVF